MGISDSKLVNLWISAQKLIEIYNYVKNIKLLKQRVLKQKCIELILIDRNVKLNSIDISNYNGTVTIYYNDCVKVHALKYMVDKLIENTKCENAKTI